MVSTESTIQFNNTSDLQHINESLQRDLAALREDNARLQQRLDNVPLMISEHGSDYTYTYVSPVCRHLLGYEPEELLGYSFYDFFHPEDRNTIIASYPTLSTFPEQLEINYRIRRKDGHYIW